VFCAVLQAAEQLTAHHEKFSFTALVASSIFTTAQLCKLKVGISEICNSASCAELTKWHRNCKALLDLFRNIALSSALTVVATSAKHFGV